MAADFAKLGEAITMIDKSDAQWVHIDVMDGRFVPNISFGQPIVKAIRPYTNKFFDVHLMIVEPDNYIDDFKKAGADGITVHYETCLHLHRSIQHIKSLGIQAGIALNPHTPISLLEDIIMDVDTVCLMSVNPGFGGQAFIQQTLDRVVKLKQLINQTGANTLIEIDGGVTSANAAALLQKGADVLVAGSFVFKSKDPIATISELKNTDAHTITA